MSVQELPPSLARTIVLGREEAMRPGFLDFPTDSGATTKSKLPGSPPDDVSWELWCDQDQRHAWRAFYRYTCQGGAYGFTHYGDTYNWVTGPGFKQTTSLQWSGTVVLERE